MKLAVFRCPLIFTRTLRSFGFPLYTRLERVWSARTTAEPPTLHRRWIEVAHRCVEEGVVLLLFSKQEYDQLQAALDSEEDDVPVGLPFFMLSSSDTPMRIRELLWLWSLMPLRYPIPCLECGGRLVSASHPSFRKCQSSDCQSLMWVEHLKWFTSRNLSEWRNFCNNIDSLAGVLHDRSLTQSEQLTSH